MSKQVNDNAYTLTRLHDKGVELAIVAGRSMGQKGVGNFPTYENMDGIPIHRLYENSQDMFLFPGKKLNRILEIAKDLKTDLIFCDQELNMRLALLIQKSLKKPIVLMVEDAGRIFAGELYNSRKMRSAMFFFGIPSGPRFWSWLCEKANTLITCSPRDQQILGMLSKNNKSVFYLPWPSYIPNDFRYASTRENGRGIYIGSLYPFKNTQEFEKTLPLILEKTKTQQFVVVGPGPQAPIIEKLEQRYGEAIRYVNHLPRTEALRLISNSYYAYSPVKIGGWGFIGDCWSMRTPIIMTHNDNYVINNVNALVANNENDLVASINRLYEDTEIYQTLQTNGYEEYEKRKADVVGDKLYSILTRVM
ncbi:MAG: glycosyltransferase [Candidatus Bathyarchaeia archaeon]|jgi:glycosyltransferase involved in cell wall biosynthesis